MSPLQVADRYVQQLRTAGLIPPQQLLRNSGVRPDTPASSTTFAVCAPPPGPLPREEPNAQGAEEAPVYPDYAGIQILHGQQEAPQPSGTLDMYGVQMTPEQLRDCNPNRGGT